MVSTKLYLKKNFTGPFATLRNEDIRQRLADLKALLLKVHFFP
jgi:hypothetical protein